MSHPISTATLFRQNFIPAIVPSADVERHWLLDFRAGRDVLLLAANLQRMSERKGPLIKFGAELDPYLEPMIDHLNLRAMPEPTTPWQLITVDFRLTLLSFKLGLSGCIVYSKPNEVGTHME